MAQEHGQEQTEDSTPETSQRFFRFFQTELTAIQQQMDRLGDTSLAGGERIDATEHCQAGIARLAVDVKDASVYIPAYDQRNYAQAIKALQDRLEQTRTAHAPKPKFAFKTARKNASAISLADAAQLAKAQHPNIPDYGSGPPSSTDPSATATPDPYATPPNELQGSEKQLAEATAGSPEVVNQSGKLRKPSFSQKTSVQISNQRAAHIILPSSAGHATTTGTISNMVRCVVDMSVPTTSGRPFAGLTLKKIKESLIVCGHVSGSAHVTGLTDCIIVVACRQFRMHECRRCDVYLQAASRPIVEDVEAVRFAPLPAFHASESERHIENMWDKVDDFKWLKNEQSPNWSILTEDQRISDDTWRKYVPGGVDHTLEEILDGVGVGERSI